MRIIAVLIAASLTLAGCQEDYGEYVDGSIHGKKGDYRPVTPPVGDGGNEDVWERIQESAGS